MAIRNTTNVNASVLTNQPPPGFTDRCTVRIKDAEFKKSGKGKPMIQLDCEILRPHQAKGVDGNLYDLTSIRLAGFIMLDEESIGYTVGTLLPLLGLPQEIDDENPDTEQFKGICFEAILRTTSKDVVKKDPENPGNYIPVVDDDNQPIKQHNMLLNAREILKRVPQPAESAF